MHVPPVFRRWVTCPEPRPQARLRLFCFHYSGGNASLYRLWATQLPASIEVCPIELPGRATRRGEPAITSFPEMLDALARRVHPFVHERPFAFFGHSFGGILAFELTRWLRRRGAAQPTRLFLSACPAWHVRPPQRSISHLEDGAFLDDLSARFGVPRHVLGSEEVRDEVLPVLRADVRLAESYRYAPEPPLELPISAFGALEDAGVTAEEVASWRQQTTGDFRLRMMPGTHFFLTTERPRLYEALLEDLQLERA